MSSCSCIKLIGRFRATAEKNDNYSIEINLLNGCCHYRSAVRLLVKGGASIGELIRLDFPGINFNIRTGKRKFMPHGFFTIEQWKPSHEGAGSQWTPIFHLDSYQSLTKAVQQLEKRGKPGLFRISQMQRCIWAEMEGARLRLHGSHASSPENLARVVEIFEREGGRRPVEKARQQRAAAKKARQ
jgi:hypothetical protein